MKRSTMIVFAICSLSIPLLFAQPAPCPGEYEEYEQFCLCYSEDHEQSLWVNYTLEREEIFLPSRERLSRFQEDKNISTGSATHDDYTHSGYDRGHLSRAMYNKASSNAYREGFYMSNISPQLPRFNRSGGDWYELEEFEIQLAKRYGKIEAFSGPIFLSENPKKIGSNQVVVPDAFFKVILVPAENKVFAYVLEHDEIKSSIEESMIEVDSLEGLVGVNLIDID